MEKQEARGKSSVLAATASGELPVLVGDSLSARLNLRSAFPSCQPRRIEFEVNPLALYDVGGQPVFTERQRFPTQEGFACTELQHVVPDSGEPPQRSGLTEYID